MSGNYEIYEIRQFCVLFNEATQDYEAMVKRQRQHSSQKQGANSNSGWVWVQRLAGRMKRGLLAQVLKTRSMTMAMLARGLRRKRTPPCSET